MDEQKILLYAALIKLVNNEPMSINDLDRFINLIAQASFAIQMPSQEEGAGMKSKLIQTVQNKFMKGQQIQ